MYTPIKIWDDAWNIHSSYGLAKDFVSNGLISNDTDEKHMYSEQKYSKSENPNSAYLRNNAYLKNNEVEEEKKKIEENDSSLDNKIENGLQSEEGHIHNSKSIEDAINKAIGQEKERVVLD